MLITISGFGFKEDKSLWVKFRAPLVGEIRFNPIVSCLSIMLIWAFVGICIAIPQDVPFKASIFCIFFKKEKKINLLFELQLQCNQICQIAKT